MPGKIIVTVSPMLDTLSILNKLPIVNVIIPTKIIIATETWHIEAYLFINLVASRRALNTYISGIVQNIM